MCGALKLKFDRIFAFNSPNISNTYKVMKNFILIVALCFFGIVGRAQNDTLPNAKSEIVEVYDVVAVYKTTTDGRGRTRNFVSEMKGEIQNYDETTGVLTFKDLDGRMYSFKTGEYKYFQYDKEFTKKVKTFVLKPRKESEIEISAGFRATFINFNDNLVTDDYYLSSGGGPTDLPMAIFLGAGKHFGREHYVGLNGELALIAYGQNYLSAGLRYCYQYDAYKRNVALYIPVELNYFQSTYNQNFQVNDSTVYTSGGGTVTTYPDYRDYTYRLSALSLSLGQGFGFILGNKHSIALELSLVKYFPFGLSFKNLDREAPNVNFSGSGFRFSFIYNI